MTLGCYEEISYWINEGFITYIGGDFNSRIDDINDISQKSLKWRYQQNVDTITNNHGRQLASICELHNILPLNHCLYVTVWEGNFTYHKANTSSQIDFIFTNQHGRKHITDFNIINNSWHMSDHLPLSIYLRLPSQISADILFARSLELAESSQSLNRMPSYRFKFNAVPAAQKLQEHPEQIMESCNTNSPDFIIETLEDCLIPILKENKIKRKPIVRNIIKYDIYEECDSLFNNKSQNCATNEDVVKESYETYQSTRNTLHANVFQFHEDKYKIILDNLDERKLWFEIKWSGGHKSSAEYQIPIQAMYNYCEHLF